MKRIFLFTVLSLFILTSCYRIHPIQIRGNGNVISQSYDVSDFSKIDVGSTFNVFLSQGETEEVVINADDNLFNVIDVELINGRLKIKTTSNISYAKELSVYIQMIDLDEIEISGASSIYTDEICQFDDIRIDLSGASYGQMQFDANQAVVDVSGASECDLDILTSILNVELSGASQLSVVGIADDCIAEISGASSYHALSTEVLDYDLVVSGASSADIYALEFLSLEASGASNIRYKGDPVFGHIELTGSSTLSHY